MLLNCSTAKMTFLNIWPILTYKNKMLGFVWLNDIYKNVCKSSLAMFIRDKYHFYKKKNCELLERSFVEYSIRVLELATSLECRSTQKNGHTAKPIYIQRMGSNHDMASQHSPTTSNMCAQSWLMPFAMSVLKQLKNDSHYNFKVRTFYELKLLSENSCKITF